MGKTPSPGKWIKNLLGKKSSKSSLAKGNEKSKSAKKEEPVVSVNDEVTNLAVEAHVVSAPAQTVVDPGTAVAEKQPSNGINASSVKDNESNDDVGPRNGSGELKQEQAATKVQAAYRAHQARRAFRTLKGIIRLQAVIRGHLVRRQAIATYSCVCGIVKLQALVRGQKTRSSDIGVQLKKTLTEAVNSETLQASSCSWMENPAKLSIVDKLLASSPTVLPLKLRYDPEDPNSDEVWLERWTRLQVWSPCSRATENLISKPLTKKRTSQMTEIGKARPKRGIKKPSGPSTENSYSRPTAENEKPKRNTRKAPTLNKEVPRIDNDKAKQSSRKTTASAREGSLLEVKDEKPRPSLKKVSNTMLSSKGPEKATRKSAEKKKDTTEPEPIELDGKASASPSDVPEADVVESLQENDTANAVSEDSERKRDEESADLENPCRDELKPVERSDEPKAVESSDKAEDVQDTNVQLCSENGIVASENAKASDKRASLPAKIDDQDDGLTHSARKLPSYMAPTASAKARVKGQCSPRFAQETAEKNGSVLRRHSLPSSANGKLSTMSPRAHRLLLASGKGSMNSDRSFSSSKDAGDKSSRAEWKR